MADGRLFIAKLDDEPPDTGARSLSADPPPQSTLLYVHVRRDLVEARAPMDTILADINDKIDRHGGIILSARQFLRHRIGLDWGIVEHFSDYSSAAEDHEEFEWGDAQRAYFAELWGIEVPYQYAGKAGYDQFAISVRDPAAYLEANEVIQALIDTSLDDVPLECPCHWTQIIYTSRRRILCMGCGQLLCVLADTLPGPFGSQVTNHEWLAAFDAEGELVDDTIEIDVVDFRTIEQAQKIWKTDVWDDVAARINFYATASPEEVERFHRSCFPSPDALVAAGFADVPTPPSTANQIGRQDYGVDLAENAARSINAAAIAFVRSKTDPDLLRDAVLAAFHAVELILKLKLQAHDPGALRRNPNNPAVLDLLTSAGVGINAEELATIAALRKLRNKLQHAGADFGYRATRRLLRRSFIFLDRFATQELNRWIGMVCDPVGWHGLLAIDAIRATADATVAQLLGEFRASGEGEIDTCPTCGKDSLISYSRHRLCIYCRTPPIPEPIDDHFGDS